MGNHQSCSCWEGNDAVVKAYPMYGDLVCDAETHISRLFGMQRIVDNDTLEVCREVDN